MGACIATDPQHAGHARECGCYRDACASEKRRAETKSQGAKSSARQTRARYAYKKPAQKSGDLERGLVSAVFGKLSFVAAKDKTYMCGSLCSPKFIVEVSAKNSEHHFDIMKQLYRLAATTAITRDELRAKKKELIDSM